jgi:hypothetical protein
MKGKIFNALTLVVNAGGMNATRSRIASLFIHAIALMMV